MRQPSYCIILLFINIIKSENYINSIAFLANAKLKNILSFGFHCFLWFCHYRLGVIDFCSVFLSHFSHAIGNGLAFIGYCLQDRYTFVFIIFMLSFLLYMLIRMGTIYLVDMSCYTNTNNNMSWLLGFHNDKFTRTIQLLLYMEGTNNTSPIIFTNIHVSYVL